MKKINIDNNGWIKINSRLDLPRYSGKYIFYYTDQKYREQWYDNESSIGGVTHWREIVDIPHPIY